jgi:hypothetical protein
MLLQNVQAEFVELLFSHQESNLVVPASHLIIYQNTIHTALRRSMLACYPFIKKLLGENFFYQTINDYIQHYPSRTPCLQDYGEYFRDFLLDYAPTRDLNYLPDVARYEWICHSLIFAPNPMSLNIEHLKNLSDEEKDQLQLALSPACRLAVFDYPMLDIIAICEEKKTHLDLETAHSKQPYPFIFYRQHHTLAVQPLTMEEYTFLQALQENKTLEEAYLLAEQVSPGFDLTKKLPQWVEKNLIVGLEEI